MKHPVLRMTARRVAALALLVLTATALVPVLPLRAQTAEAVEVARLGGVDRYETAAVVARQTYGPDSPSGQSTTVALLARGDVFVDSLCGNGLAGALDAAVLLTQPEDLPEVTRAALEDLGITEVILLGGTEAIGTEVEAELEGFETRRLGGADRFETCAAINDAIGPDEVGRAPRLGDTATPVATPPVPSTPSTTPVTLPPSTTPSRATAPTTPVAAIPATPVATPSTPVAGPSTPVASPGPGDERVPTGILANGATEVDVLVAGPLAYKGAFPVFLTGPDGTVEDSQRSVIARLGIRQLIVVGGPEVVAADELAALADDGVASLQVAGGDRFATAERFARFVVETFDGVALGDGDDPDSDFDASDVAIARGDDFADALAGAQFAAAVGAPYLLVNPCGVVPEPTLAFVTDVAKTLERLHVFGGVAAVCDAVVAELEQAAGDSAVPPVTSVPPPTPSSASGA